MPATTSALMALRLSGRLMVIQNACPRFSRITLLTSFIVPLACLLLLCKHLRQDGGGLQAGIRGAVPSGQDTENQRSQALGSEASDSRHASPRPSQPCRGCMKAES